MTETAKQSRGLPGTLWLGTTGVALMVAGIVAFLAANWHRVPLWAQVMFALVPLVAGWAGYAWLRLRKINSLGAQEVIGTVWAGGVVCSLALLGRVLQASFTQLTFCLTVAGLLLPVIYAVRTTFAWVAYCVFLLVAVVHSHPELGSCRTLGRYGYLVLLIVGLVLLLPRLAWAWRTAGGYARTQRVLVSVFAIPVALLMGFEMARFGEGAPVGHRRPACRGWRRLFLGKQAQGAAGTQPRGGRPGRPHTTARRPREHHAATAHGTHRPSHRLRQTA